MRHVRHAVKLDSSGGLTVSAATYVIAHGHVLDPVQRICIITADGILLQSYGGTPGLQILDGGEQLNAPCRLQVADNGLLFVADSAADRILMFKLKPSLRFIAEIISNIVCKAGLCVIDNKRACHRQRRLAVAGVMKNIHGSEVKLIDTQVDQDI